MIFIVIHSMSAIADSNPARAVPDDVILVLASSNAMGDLFPAHTAKTAMQAFVSLLDENDRAGIVTAAVDNTTMQSLISLDSDENIKHLVDRIDAISGTEPAGSLPEALQAARQLIEQSTLPDKRDMHVVVLASGQSAGDELSDQLLLWFKTGYIPVHVVTRNNAANNRSVKTITSATGGTLINSDSGQPLTDIVSRLGRAIKNENVTNVNGRSFKVDESMGYFKLLVIPGGKAAALKSPSGQTLSAGSQDTGILWRANDAFNAITANKPETGNWTIQSEEATTHVVLHYPAVIDIGYEIARNTIKSGDRIKITAWLEKNDQPVTGGNIIQFLKVRLRTLLNGDVIDDSSLFPEQGSPTRFFTYIQLDQPGEYTFQLTMEDDNLHRETRFTRKVAPLKTATPPSNPPVVAIAGEIAAGEPVESAQQQQTADSPGSTEEPALLDKVVTMFPHLKEALVIATGVNGVAIIIGGLAYYRRRLRQQTADIDFLTSISGRNADTGKVDMNNAAA